MSGPAEAGAGPAVARPCSGAAPAGPAELTQTSLCSRSVSQELSETILTMVANCSNVMNKARQPPPGVMPKGRAPSTSSLDAISPVQVSRVPAEPERSAARTDSQLLLSQMDPLSGMGSLNLGGSTPSHSQNMPGFPTSLSSAFSNPQSPAKAFPALSNPNPSTPFGGIGSLSSQLSGGGPLLPDPSGLHACTQVALFRRCVCVCVFQQVLWAQVSAPVWGCRR